MKSFNVRLNDEMLSELKYVSSIMGKSVSELVREGIEKILEEKKLEPYYKLTNFSEMSKAETAEIMKNISKLSEDDLRIVKRRKSTL